MHDRRSEPLRRPTDSLRHVLPTHRTAKPALRDCVQHASPLPARAAETYTALSTAVPAVKFNKVYPTPISAVPSTNIGSASDKRSSLGPSMDRFVWLPGNGIDAAALDRLRTHFRQPKEPMGEAWFMGEHRRLFQELRGDLALLSARDLQEPLQEIASGTSSFGPMAEWHSWYHYLLGQVLPRSHECFVTSLLESLITGFMALYPNGVHSPPYRQFLDDAFFTLGRCIMDDYCWSGADIVVGTILHRSNNNPNCVWCWWDASGDFSASMFFCLKYLSTSQVEGWLQSVLEIPSPHWRAQVLVWLVGAHDILSGRVQWPSEFLVDARPSVGWEWSHCLRPELAAAEAAAPSVASFLPESSRSLALGLVSSHFTEDVYLDWLLSISRFPYLEAELAEIPSTFEGLYVRAG